MTMLSVRFSQALEKGRRCAAPVNTRGAILRSLLQKRATARAAGAMELEALLRDQIAWSLPIQRGERALDARRTPPPGTAE